MKVAYFGTSPFAVPALEALVRRGAPHEVVGVVTQPVRPRGRGLRPEPSPVARAAAALGLKVLEIEDVRDPSAAERLRGLAADLFLVVAYGGILPPAVLRIPPLGAWNIHASLLPRHRGASPVAWTLLEGDPEAGVTLFRIVEGVDTGAVLLQRSTLVGPRENAPRLTERLALLGAEAALEGLSRIARGRIELAPQEEARATRTRRFAREDGRIDWRRPAAEIDRRVRALDPWPGTFTTWGGKTLKVLEAEPAEGRGAPGEVLEAGRRFVVAAGLGAVALLKVQAASGRPLGGAEFVRGRRLKPGDRLGS